MRLYDQSTMDLAQAVQDVLEGKTTVKEMKYPHDMFDPKTGKKEVAKDEAQHKALDAKGYTHEAPKENVAGPADLSVDQNVKKVQAKHGAVKKVDLTPESVQEAYNKSLVIQAIQEARQLKDPKTEVLVVKNGKVEVINKTDVKKFMAKGYELAENTITISLPASLSEKKATIDLDFEDGGNKEMKRIEKKYKVKFKKRRDGGFDVTGDTKSLHNLLKGDEYAYDKEDIKDMFPEVLEAKDIEEAKSLDKEDDIDEAEMSAKQAAYRKVFDGAMKKFGVKSPAELKGDKKKEFFDYVDANYDAEGEVEEGVGDFFNKAKKAVKKGVDKVTGADKKSKSANDAQAGATAALSKRARPGGDDGASDEKKRNIRIRMLKDKIANALEKSKAADKRDDDDAVDHWNEVEYNANSELEDLQANEGVGDFFNKAKKAVKKGVDKVTGGDKNAKFTGDRIKTLKDKIKNAMEKSTAADKRDDEDARAHWDEVIYNAESDLEDLQAK